MKELRAGPRQSLVAMYSDTEVVIKSKNGDVVILQVVNGKLVQKKMAL